MSKSKTRNHVQFGALPIKYQGDGGCRIMLLTSRETHRWVIPKGWPIHGRKGSEVAIQEAFEEAGLIGKIIGKHPVGSCHYAKQLAPGRDILCEVKVYLFLVERQLDDWPEKAERQARWFTPRDAYSAVDEGGSAEILLHTYV